MLNVVALMGRLVADPELRHTPQGVSVTTFTIAVDRSYAKQGTERQTVTAASRPGPIRTKTATTARPSRSW